MDEALTRISNFESVVGLHRAKCRLTSFTWCPPFGFVLQGDALALAVSLGGPRATVRLTSNGWLGGSEMLSHWG